MRTALWSVPIGILAHGPQRAIAQEPTAAPVTVAAEDARLRERFASLLLAASTRDLQQGFSLAAGLGPVAAPALWAMHAAEKSNMHRRAAALCAACIAEGPSGIDRTVSILDDRSPLHDRLCVALMAALGPVQQRTRKDFWPRILGRNQKEPEPLLLVAALLASSRWSGAGADCPQGLLRTTNPGIVAAAVYAGAPVPEPVLAPFFRREPPAHASLVHRASLLVPLLRREPIAEGLQQQALAFLQAPREENAPLRELAALVLSHAGVPPVEGEPRPDWQRLCALAADPRSAAALAAWLPPSPQPLDEPGWPQLAVAYAFSRSVDTILAERAQWHMAPAFRRHVAVTLALRLCAEAAPQPIPLRLEGLPEWEFVRWASGVQELDVRALPEDPELARGLVLCAEARIDKGALRGLLEETLWRWGSHPGRLLYRAQGLLVRDLLLAGSLPGQRYPVGLPDHQRYLPAGLGNENAFFRVGVEAYEFMKAKAPPIPAECRLR